MDKITKILLLDGYSTRTLACVRSWGKQAIPFVVGGETKWDMSLFSRYCREKFIYTSPKRDVTKFIEDVNRYCKQFGADCVFPTSEAAIMACSKSKNNLICFPIIPQEAQIRALFSKTNTLRIAETLGIPVPKTLYIPKGNFKEIDTVNLSFPVVVKSESSEVLGGKKAVTSAKTSYVHNRDALLSDCRSRLAQGNGVLLQDFIDGYGVGVSGIFVEGRPVALISHRRIRESNPVGGPSALAETVEVEPQLLKMTTALANVIGFTGPAMFEYKIERETKQPYLMEINGRFWGSVLLASVAGLDLPYLYWKALNGLEISPEETNFRVGVRGRNLLADTKSLFLSLRGRPRNWPGEFPKRRAALESYLQGFFDKRTKELILTRDDPMPFFARLTSLFINAGTYARRLSLSFDVLA
jgi:predicted ATP-grasp superfamily ATP-dependent carboligase